MVRHRISPLEAVGLKPIGRGLEQCRKAIAGSDYEAAARWDLSSLRIFRPALGPATWAGWSRPDRKIPILNFFNRDHAARDEGYDVRTTRVRDYRGGRRTYNGHMGTDFVVPVGSTVCAAAAGRVVRVENLMQRGGLKIVIDHGGGLITLCGHLARAFVRAGDVVGRGDRIGLSGFSAVDGILFFPWVPPHVHMTVVLGGVPIDPFAADGEVSMWRSEQPPTTRDTEMLPPIAWDHAAVERTLRSCRDPELVADFDTWREPGHAAVYWQVFSYAAFTEHPPLYAGECVRRPFLHLPFDPDEFAGIA